MDEVNNQVLVVITGSSGVGKDAIINRMKELDRPFFYAVTATSRLQRPGETDGVDYHFIAKQKFEEMIENGEFLEWANVYGNLYGVPKKAIIQAMSEGHDVIVKVDIQGAATIKRIDPKAITIFIAPPSMEELRRRLIERKTESQEDLDTRIKTAEHEMENKGTFDYVVVNYNNLLDQAIAEIEAIIKKEKPSEESVSGEISQERGPELIDKKKIEALSQERVGDKVLRIKRRPRRRLVFLRLFRKIRAMMRWKR